MATEVHKLIFVRCPKCYQLLVEYPSIPVYKCGGCGTVLRVKHRAVPALQAKSECGDQSSSASSPKGPPQDNKPSCSDDRKIASSVDQACAAVADGIISSPINNTTTTCEDAIEERAVSVADSVAHGENQKEEPHLLIAENSKTPGITVKEMQENGARADSGSHLIGELENLDTSDNANSSKADKVCMSEMRTEVVQKEERLYTYEGMHIESHDALIEELERSLSFSSDDEYFSDEAETSGLSDALRHQMGSSKLGGKINETCRNDPHGRLIEELEMSFSDAEEPMEQHAMDAGRIHGNKHVKHPQMLDAENANPCEEIIPSLHSGHDQTFHQGSRRIENANERKEDVEDDSNLANDHGNEHDTHLHTSTPPLDNGHLEQAFVQENRRNDYSNQGMDDTELYNSTANRIDHDNEGKEHIEVDNNSANDHDAHLQTLDPNTVHHCEESAPPLDKGHLEYDQAFLQGNRQNDYSNQGKDDTEVDNSTTNVAHRNVDIVVVNEVSEETFHEKEQDKDLQPTIAEIVHPFEMSVSLIDDSYMKLKQTIQPNCLTADGTQENKEACMDDGSMNNYIHRDANMACTDEDITEKVHGNEEEAFDRTGEYEENCVEDSSLASYVHGEQNDAVADEHIVEKVDKNKHDKDQQSQEAQLSNTGHVKSEVFFKQKDLIADGTTQKEEGAMRDGNTTNSIKKDSATVASFSSWTKKKTQCKLPSFNKKEEATYKYRASESHQGLSLDAKDFRSIQNFIESQIDDASSSLSSGSPSQGDLVHGRSNSNEFNHVVRHERLKKMDELRDQLSRLSSQKSVEEKCQKRGPEYQQQSNSYDLQSVDIDSVPNSCTLESYYGYERPPRYQPPNIFSPTHAYPRCDFGHTQARIPHNYDVWEFNSYYQSSYAESTIHGHDSVMSSYKEPRQVVRKHILRPLSGASPFSICSCCFSLIQMPSDMYISKAKVGKMQCGRCSKVLVLSFPVAYHAEGKISMDVLQQSNKKDATSHSAECLRESVSINEVYGASLTRSFSTQAGQSSIAATQSGKKVSNSALHQLMGYDSASQLLHHSRVFDDGYDSFESMVPVSSRVSRRKNM